MQEEEADNQDRHDASRRRVLWLLLFIDISKISDEGLTVATKRFRGKRFWYSQDSGAISCTAISRILPSETAEN
jgi:hypothetical protein